MKVSPRSARKISLLVVFFMVFAQALSGAPLFAQTSAVTGKIQSITSIAGGQFEIVLKTDKGTSKFVIDGASTLIQQMVPAREVKKGQRIAIAPSAGMKGSPAKKGGLQDMAPAVKEALGLPDIPNIPATPNVPALPKVPQVPKTPNVPKVPQAPQMPNIPAGAPGAPKPAGAGGGASAPQGAPGEGGEAPAGQAAPSAETEQRPPDQDYPEPPKEARSSVMKKSGLSSPTAPLPKVSGKTVVSLEESSEGIKVELEGEEGKREEAVLPADAKVMRLLTVKDLAKNMSVTLDVAPGGDDNFVQRVTVV